MAVTQMPQKVLFILFKALVLSVVKYGFGLLILSTVQLYRLKEAMRYALALPPMADRHKLAQVKAYTRVAADTSNPLYKKKIGRAVETKLKRGTEWLTQAPRGHSSIS